MQDIFHENTCLPLHDILTKDEIAFCIFNMLYRSQK